MDSQNKIDLIMKRDLCIYHSNLRCDSFYNLPTNIGNSRATGIGKGNKMKLAIDNKVPAPGKYNVKSAFEEKSKGVQFRLGR